MMSKDEIKANYDALRERFTHEERSICEVTSDLNAALSFAERKMDARDFKYIKNNILNSQLAEIYEDTDPIYGVKYGYPYCMKENTPNLKRNVIANMGEGLKNAIDALGELICNYEKHFPITEEMEIEANMDIISEYEGNKLTPKA